MADQSGEASARRQDDGFGAEGEAGSPRAAARAAAPPTVGRAWPLAGDLPAVRKDPLALYARAAQAGDVVRLRLGRDVYLLNHPDHVQRVLHENHGNYRKSFFYARMKPLVGEGLLTSEGSAWKRRRRLAQPAFHKDRVASFARIMAEHTVAMLDRWARPAARGEPVDVTAEVMRLTLTVVGHALFGFDLLGEAEDARRAFTEALRITHERFYSLVYVPPSVPTPRNVRFARAMRVLDGVVNEVISARRREPARQDDLLGMLLEARDIETGEGLGDEELRDEVMTMVLAGHETTANALAWAFHLLSLAPDVARRLRDESTAVLGDRRLAEVDDLPRLGFATRVYQEAMRLYPPAWIFGREAIEADAFGAFTVPAGGAVAICPWLLHRDPRWWESPEGFDPDRFAPSKMRPKYAYVPFAAGPRMCIGNAFAMMEMQIVLAMASARYRLDLVPGRRVEVEPSVTLRPRSGIWMTVHPHAAG
jgi:cytochrome P450